LPLVVFTGLDQTQGLSTVNPPLGQHGSASEPISNAGPIMSQSICESNQLFRHILVCIEGADIELNLLFYMGRHHQKNENNLSTDLYIMFQI
jgi:hypothetical protein